MTPVELLVETMQHLPSATPSDLFRMCMLQCHSGALDVHQTAATRSQMIQDLQMQLTMQEDQYAGVTSELDCLASTEPCQFSVEHLWTLIRSIKVQSQLLELLQGDGCRSAV